MYLQSHGGKHSCCYCEGVCSFRPGKMRTFGGLRKRHAQFLRSGGKIKDAMKYANCINRCLINEEDHVRVVSKIPPGELHILMGCINTHMDLLIKMFGLPFVENWTKSINALRHGYQVQTIKRTNEPIHPFEKIFTEQQLLNI